MRRFVPLAMLAAWLAASPLLAQEEAPAAVANPSTTAAPEEPPGPEPGKPWIGVQLAPLDEALRAQLGLGEGVGWLISEVFPGSPAAAAGLKKFDVVVAAAGKPLEGDFWLSKIVKASGETPVPVEIIRGGRRQTVEVTPKPAPPRPQPNQAGLLTLYGLDYTDPLRTELPADVEIEIKKKGAEPASIIVRRGRMIWEMTPGDSFERLPEDIRGSVAALLGRSDYYSLLGRFSDPVTVDVDARSGVNGTVQLRTVRPDLGMWQQLLRVPAVPPTQALPPAAVAPAGVEQRLEDIARRLDAIEKSLSEKK